MCTSFKTITKRERGREREREREREKETEREREREREGRPCRSILAYQSLIPTLSH